MSSPVTIWPSIDNYLDEYVKTTNRGGEADLYTRLYPGANRRVLMAFDFSALVPVGATITAATLSLYCYTKNASRTLTTQRLLRTDWVEAQSTWNIYKGDKTEVGAHSHWSTIGALSDGNDFTSTDGATTSLTGTGWLSWGVTNQVKTAFASVGGIAHFILSESGGANGSANYYYSRSYATDTSLRPKLYIEYTVPSAVTPSFLPFFWV